jgi:hypothetical protein
MERLSKHELCQNAERECDQPLPKKIKIEVKTEPEPDFSLPPPLPRFIKEELETEVRILLDSYSNFFIHNPHPLESHPRSSSPSLPSPTYPPSPASSDRDDLDRRELITEFMKRIVRMDEELKEIERRKSGTAERKRVGKVLTHSTEWLDAFDKYYNERMIEYFEGAIDMLEGKTESKCGRNMFFTDCTCDIGYDDGGKLVAIVEGTCKACIARHRDEVLMEMERKGKPITRSQVKVKAAGPSFCFCTHCLAGNWETYDALVHSQTLYQGYGICCGCEMEPLISSKCDICLIKFAAASCDV